MLTLSSSTMMCFDFQRSAIFSAISYSSVTSLSVDGTGRASFISLLFSMPMIWTPLPILDVSYITNGPSGLIFPVSILPWSSSVPYFPAGAANDVRYAKRTLDQS